MKTTNDSKNQQNQERTKCEIYTRVMWYHRPVSSYNIWKKAEFYSRNYFKENVNENENFVKEYSC